MNTKQTRIQILSLMTLTVMLGALPSMGLVDDSWMLEAPMRLGNSQVAFIAFSPDGAILFAAHRTNSASRFWEAQSVFYWDPQSQEQVGALTPHTITSIALSPDGTILASTGGANGTVRLWDVAGQYQVGVIQAPDDVSFIAFSLDGRILASSGHFNNAIRLWDAQTQKQIGVLPKTGNGARPIIFSPDGRLLVSGGHRGSEALRLWEVGSQSQVGELVGHLGLTNDLAFSPDGIMLVSAGGAFDQAAYLWDIQTQDLIGVLGGHSAHVGSVAFSPDGTLLASTVYWDDTIHLWDVSAQEEIGLLTGHDATDFGWSDEVAFSSDGKWLACGSENGVELWQANLPAAAPRTSAFGPRPRDGAMHNDTWVNLNWRAGEFTVSHDVYLGDNFDDVNEGADEAYRGHQSETTFIVGFQGYAIPEGLVPDTTYYWRIDEVNNVDPNSPWKGPVWSFAIPPTIAYDPDPADGTESVDSNVLLTWTAGFGARLHTVYFGDNFDDVVNATEGILQSQMTYSPGALEPGKAYYWRIDEFDGIETHKGDIWGFTTPVTGGN